MAGAFCSLAHLRLHHSRQACDDFDEVINLDLYITDAYLNRPKSPALTPTKENATDESSDTVRQVSVELWLRTG